MDVGEWSQLRLCITLDTRCLPNINQTSFKLLLCIGLQNVSGCFNNSLRQCVLHVVSLCCLTVLWFNSLSDFRLYESNTSFMCVRLGWQLDLITYDINTLRPIQNGRHFPGDIFKWIFVNVNVWISISISLKFVARGPINNIPTLVQVMVWRRTGDKPLSEPMMVKWPTHICVTRPQWIQCVLSSDSKTDLCKYWLLSLQHSRPYTVDSNFMNLRPYH